jgi:hypothetical protein
METIQVELDKKLLQATISLRGRPIRIVPHWFETPFESTSGCWRDEYLRIGIARAIRDNQQGATNRWLEKRRRCGRNNSPRGHPSLPCLLVRVPLNICPP